METKGFAVAKGRRKAFCQSKSCQMLHNNLLYTVLKIAFEKA